MYPMLWIPCLKSLKNPMVHFCLLMFQYCGFSHIFLGWKQHQMVYISWRFRDQLHLHHQNPWWRRQCWSPKHPFIWTTWCSCGPRKIFWHFDAFKIYKFGLVLWQMFISVVSTAVLCIILIAVLGTKIQ